MVAAADKRISVYIRLSVAAGLEQRKDVERMITLTKLRGEQFTLNCDLIETISENPDTTILLTNGNIHIVKESMEEVVHKSIDYHRKIFVGAYLANRPVKEDD